GPVAGELHRTALLGRAPGAVVAVGEGSDAGSEFPLLVDRPLAGGAPTAYVCRHFVCDAPTTDAGELAAKLGG
ncbi:hypothetical protein AB0K87_30555, partial [Streptomyces sp. NPDC053705]